MPGSPELSVVVLSWNTEDLTRRCLASLREARGATDVEVVVIDNGSRDGSADMIAREFPGVRLVRNRANRGYAGGVNQGLALARGRFLCLLGSDTRVRPGTFEALLGFLHDHPAVGAVAPPLLNEDGTYQHACMRFPNLATVLWWDTPLQHFWPGSKELTRYQMKDWDHHGTRPVEQPPGTCLLVRRAVWERVGPMDERLWLFFNDVDWALRIWRAGFEIWYVESPGVYHAEGGSTRNFEDFAGEWHRNRVRFYRKHHHAAGHVMSKGAAVYVALRQCFRIRRHLPFGREYLRHCRDILRLLWGVLKV